MSYLGSIEGDGCDCVVILCVIQTVQCLLEHGADPSATEPLNRAPLLHIASERGCLDMVELLLTYNADLNQVDSRGNTALWQACRNGHLDIAEILIEK